MPPTETTTFPVVAPAGTGATMRVFDQLVVRAAMPLNSTKLALVPTVGPKFVPLTLTTVPMGPALGLTLLTFGGGVTVKGRPLLAVPLRSEEHTSELQSRGHLVCRLLLEKKKK